MRSTQAPSWSKHSGVAFILPTVIGLLLASLPLHGHAQTTVGGFAGPSLRLTTIDGDAVLLFGGHGGASVRLGNAHAFTLGGGVYRLTAASAEVGSADALRALNIRYGGVELGYVLNADRVLHAGVRTLLGRGTTSFRFVDVDTSFFVAELAPHITVNFTSNLRAEAAVGYRYVQGASLNGITDAMLRAPFFEFTALFGRFGPARTLGN
ncbi:MAG: hypothetical protein AAF730_20080 [Bacteroidota bacterium]